MSDPINSQSAVVLPDEIVSKEKTYSGNEFPAPKSTPPTVKRSILWLIAIFLAYCLGTLMFGAVLGAIEGFQQSVHGQTTIDKTAMAAKIQEQMATPGGIAGMYILQFLFVMPIVIWASNFSTQPWRETLALKKFPPSQLKLWSIILAIYLLAEFAITSLLEVDGGEFVKTISGSKSLGLTFAFIVLAPIMEETIFRGYLFKAWRNTRIGLSGTLILTSAIFTSLHAGQYGFSILAMLFVFSLILGLAREKSGSIWLPITLHSINNTISAITVLYFGMTV